MKCSNRQTKFNNTRTTKVPYITNDFVSILGKVILIAKYSIALSDVNRLQNRLNRSRNESQRTARLIVYGAWYLHSQI